MPKNYELIEHTADVGIRVKGDDLEGLFANAALAMFDVMAEAGNEEAEKKEIKIEIEIKPNNAVNRLNMPNLPFSVY